MVALLSRQFCLREERGRGEQAFSQPVVLSQAIHIPLSTCYVQFQSDWLTLKQIITITLTRSTVRVLQAAYVPHAMQVAETKTKCQLMWPEIHIFRRSVRDLHMIVSKEPNNQHWLEVVSWARFGVGHDFQTSLQPLVVPKTRDETNSSLKAGKGKLIVSDTTPYRLFSGDMPSQETKEDTSVHTLFVSPSSGSPSDVLREL